MRLKNHHVGRWATTLWDDTGRQDCLIVDVDVESQDAQTYDRSNGLIRVEASQVIEIRDFLESDITNKNYADYLKK